MQPNTKTKKNFESILKFQYLNYVAIWIKYFKYCLILTKQWKNTFGWRKKKPIKIQWFWWTWTKIDIWTRPFRTPRALIEINLNIVVANIAFDRDTVCCWSLRSGCDTKCRMKSHGKWIFPIRLYTVSKQSYSVRVLI